MRSQHWHCARTLTFLDNSIKRLEQKNIQINNRITEKRDLRGKLCKARLRSGPKSRWPSFFTTLTVWDYRWHLPFLTLLSLSHCKSFLSSGPTRPVCSPKCSRFCKPDFTNRVIHFENILPSYSTANQSPTPLILADGINFCCVCFLQNSVISPHIVWKLVT